MRKRSIFLIIVGLILVLIPYAINQYTIFRLISLLLGIIAICLGCVITLKKNKIIWVMVIPIVFMVGTYFSDLLLTRYFYRIPIISLETKSSNRMSIYNALGYRVYNCNSTLYFDNNYKEPYMCNNNDISVMSINKFLASPQDSFKKYNGKFVHLEGKIDTIIGTSSLYLNAYTESDTTLNGFVDFDDTKKIVVDNLEIDPADYYIYDNVEVIGQVSYLINDNEDIEIHLIDAKIIKSAIYNNYSVVVNELTSKDVTKKEDKIYFAGIEGIYYSYDKDNKYELTYLLKDKRETIDNLIKDIEGKLINTNDTLYKLDKYNIIVCDNGNTIFANKDINDFEKICEIEN